MENLSWPEPPDLQPNGIHLWWARVDRGRAADETVLSLEERERARRFRFARDRNAFVARRDRLRRLLAAYLDADPAVLAFARGPQGKPALAASDPDRSIHFNLSHSEDLVVIAVARHAELGVDVQAHEVGRGWEEVAPRVFTEREQGQLAALAPARREEAFYRGWARKEAALKALGTGFSLEPRALEVGLEARSSEAPWRPPAGPAAHLDAHTLLDLATPAGFAAAVCAGGDAWTAQVVAPPG